MFEEKENVETYLKELRSVIEYPDDLTYDDIMDKMQLAYKVASIYSEQDDSIPESVKVKRSEELSSIISKLGKIAKTKDVPVNTVSAPVQSESEIVTEAPKKKSEKKIPAPVFDEPEVAEAKVESAVSATEMTQSQIDEAITIQNDMKKPVTNNVIVGNVTVSNTNTDRTSETYTRAKSEEVRVGKYEDAVVVDKENDPEVIEINIQQPVKSEEVNLTVEAKLEEKETPLAAIPTLAPKPTEEEKTEMEIDAPSIEQQIIVSDDKDTKPVETDDDTDLDYSFLDNKPFEGDDDLDTDDEVDLSNVVFEDKPSEKELRERKITEEFSEIPEGMQMVNIKSISRKKISDTLKALSKIKTDNLDIGKITMFDYQESDEVIRREYLKTRNDMIATPKVSRIALLMSGHYEEMSSYSNYDLVSIERNISNPDVSFVDREMIMLNSIYQHVKYVSYSTEKPSFEDWCKNILFPDMASLYFGVYDANSVGDNNYALTCPYCGEAISIARPNRDLTVAVPKELTQDKLDKFITTKDVMKLDSTEMSKQAKNTKVVKQLKNSKIIVEYAIPTLYDYLVVLNTAQRISRRDLGDSLDLSAIDLFSSEGKEEDATRILGYLYIKSIGIPAQVEGTNKFRYIRLTSKADIIEHINGLDMDDYREIFTGQKVEDLFIKTATKYYLENVECQNPDCKKTIKYVSLDPKQIFFFKIGEERDRLM